MDDGQYNEDPGAGVLRGLSQRASRIKGLDGLTELYRRSAARGPRGFFGRILTGLGLELDDRHWRARLGKEGPLLVMASGPVDAETALSLMAAIEHRRDDAAALATRALGWVPELQQRMMLLQVGRGSANENASELRRALKHLRGGGALACFPWPGGASFAAEDLSRGLGARIAAWFASAARAMVLPVHLRRVPKQSHRITLFSGALMEAYQLGNEEGRAELAERLRFHAILLRARYESSQRFRLNDALSLDNRFSH